MAIDTAEKRKAIAGIWIPMMPGVTPHEAKDKQWRAQSGWCYGGFLLSLAAIWWLYKFILGK